MYLCEILTIEVNIHSHLRIHISNADSDKPIIRSIKYDVDASLFI
jgi:hypothetical protein